MLDVVVLAMDADSPEFWALMRAVVSSANEARNYATICRRHLEELYLRGRTDA